MCGAGKPIFTLSFGLSRFSAPPSKMGSTSVQVFLVLASLLLISCAPCSSLPTVHHLSLSTPPQHRWLHVVRAESAVRGNHALSGDVVDFVGRVIPGDVVMGLAPVVDAFMETFKDTKVVELQGIVAAINGEVGLRDLVLLNILVEMRLIFPTRSQGNFF